VINQHLTSLVLALQDVDSDAPRLQSWGNTAAGVLLAGGRLLACGTGGSVQQAAHLAVRLARAEDDRPPLGAVVLQPAKAVDADAASAGAFADQVQADGRAGDLLLCVCADNTDGELTDAVTAAHEVGMTAWALTGPAPNPLAAACDDTVSVAAVAPSTAQEVHLAAINIFCDAVDSAIRDAVRAAETGERRTVRRAGSSPRIGANWHPQAAHW